jgi:hypothetical protein
LEDEGYTHLKVNHSVNYKDPETGAHTNTIEGSWLHAKKSLPEYGTKKVILCLVISPSTCGNEKSLAIMKIHLRNLTLL